jgi:phosphonate transport system substrate-binding protein
MEIMASVYPCEETILDHMGAGLIDLAHLNTVAYVIGSDTYGIEAKLATIRFGLSYYTSQINVPAAAGYTDIMDLQNKRFAFANESSTSGYYVPCVLIKNSTGMTPEDFFSETYFAGHHDNVIIDVYEGNADGGASYVDARDAVEGTYPDVKTVVSVLAVSTYIPNSPWAFRPGQTGVGTLSDGIIAVANTVEGDTALETILNYGIDGFEAVDDSAYDILRDVVDYFNLVLETCFEIFLPITLR